MATLTNYHEYRKNMATGDLLQWRGRGPFSEAIKIGTGQFFTHSSFLIRLNEYSDHIYSIEALDNGLFMYRLSTLLEKYEGTVDVFPIKNKFKYYATGAAAWLLDRQGTGYDWNWTASQRGKVYERMGLTFLADKVIELADEAKLACTESVFMAFKDGPQEWGLDPINHLQRMVKSPVPGNEMVDLLLWLVESVKGGFHRGINIAQ